MSPMLTITRSKILDNNYIKRMLTISHSLSITVHSRLTMRCTIVLKGDDETQINLPLSSHHHLVLMTFLKENNRPPPTKRRARKTTASVMDYELTILAGHVYQSWLQDASDILCGEGKKRKARGTITEKMKREVLLETGPTQTQKPVITHSEEKVTDSIKSHLKAHFERPGAPQMESLNKLALGMNRNAAGQLFYQSCVLATRGYIKVDQAWPYGDILMARGANIKFSLVVSICVV